MRKRRALGSTTSVHATKAEEFFSSARNNFRRHGNAPDHSACSSIGHMTDVVAEAQVAVIEAMHAGNRNLEASADRLMHEATVKQQAYVAACRRRERALQATGQSGDRWRRSR